MAPLSGRRGGGAAESGIDPCFRRHLARVPQSACGMLRSAQPAVERAGAGAPG